MDAEIKTPREKIGESSDFTPEVLSLLEASRREIQGLQARQMSELTKLIDRLSLELADVLYADEVRRIRMVRMNKRAPEEAREHALKRMQDLVNQARSTLMESMVTPEKTDDSIQAAQKTIDEIIKSKGIDKDDASAVLEAIGAIQYDDQGGVELHWPSNIFPAETTEKLDAYAVAVGNHEDAAKRVTRDDEDSVNALTRADLARRNAHNAVAMDVGKILQFKHADGEPYETADYRQLIAEMLKTYKDSGSENS